MNKLMYKIYLFGMVLVLLGQLVELVQSIRLYLVVRRSF